MNPTLTPLTKQVLSMDKTSFEEYVNRWDAEFREEQGDTIEALRLVEPCGVGIRERGQRADAAVGGDAGPGRRSQRGFVEHSVVSR